MTISLGLKEYKHITTFSYRKANTTYLQRATYKLL